VVEAAGPLSCKILRNQSEAKRRCSRHIVRPKKLTDTSRLYTKLEGLSFSEVAEKQLNIAEFKKDLFSSLDELRFFCFHV
jgi:hypothetical protein